MWLSIADWKSSSYLVPRKHSRTTKRCVLMGARRCRSQVLGRNHSNYCQCFSTAWYDVVRRCNTLQHAATRCNTLQHAATRCNTLQHTDVVRRETTAEVNRASLKSIQGSWVCCSVLQRMLQGILQSNAKSCRVLQQLCKTCPSAHSDPIFGYCIHQDLCLSLLPLSSSFPDRRVARSRVGVWVCRCAGVWVALSLSQSSDSYKSCFLRHSSSTLSVALFEVWHSLTCSTCIYICMYI